MLGSWKELVREVAGAFRIFKVLRLESRSPRTGQALEFFTIDCADWVNVIALTVDGNLILVRQYRHGSSTFTVEIPGGGVAEGEDPVDAGLRELREESGFGAGEARFLGSVNPNPAIFGNRCATILATGCTRIGEPEPDPGEDIEVLTKSPEEVRSMLAKGEIDHALVLAAFQHLERSGIAGF